MGVVEAKIWSDTLTATLTFLASSDPGAVVGDGVLVLALGEEEEVWKNMPDNKDLDKEEYYLWQLVSPSQFPKHVTHVHTCDIIFRLPE